MIEIITPGILNRSIAKCNHCGCQFYYDESDTQPTLGLTYIAARHVKCPCCHFEIQVSYHSKLVEQTQAVSPWCYEEEDKCIK